MTGDQLRTMLETILPEGEIVAAVRATGCPIPSKSTSGVPSHPTIATRIPSATTGSGEWDGVSSGGPPRRAPRAG